MNITKRGTGRATDDETAWVEAPPEALALPAPRDEAWRWADLSGLAALAEQPRREEVHRDESPCQQGDPGQAVDSGIQQRLEHVGHRRDPLRSSSTHAVRWASLGGAVSIRCGTKRAS